MKLRQTVRSTRLSSGRVPISSKGLGAYYSKTNKGSKKAKKRANKKQAMLGEKKDDDAARGDSDSVEEESLFRRFDSKHNEDPQSRRWNDGAFDSQNTGREDGAFDFNRQGRDRPRRVARLSRRWDDGAFDSRKDRGGKLGEDEYFEHQGAALGGEFLGASFDDGGESEYSAYDEGSYSYSDSAFLGASFDDDDEF